MMANSRGSGWLYVQSPRSLLLVLPSVFVSLRAAASAMAQKLFGIYLNKNKL
jgi:hypothetical protein